MEITDKTSYLETNRPTKNRAESSPWSALEAFESGRHREVVERVKAPGKTAAETLALIGSLSFLGRIDEALELWKIGRARLAPGERARARFSIGLACMRVSRFKLARGFFNRNLKDAACRFSADVYQGVGIYYFYTGQFEKSLRFAKLAMKRSLENGDAYIRAFATDLQGHALVQTGRRSAGLRLLAEAQELAKRESKADVFSPQRLIYESEAGLRPHSIVEELRQQVQLAGRETSYTHANLVLELARQLTLRGRWREARELLDAESPTIYAFENRRQDATLQLRLAEIAYRRGEVSTAQHFLQAARRCLNKIADSVFEIRILGLELKIERDLLGREPSLMSLARLEQLSRKHPSPMNSRINGRNSRSGARSLGTAHEPAPGEDPLGDLLDLAGRDPERGAGELMRAGYLGLWPQARGLKPGTEALVVFESGRWLAVGRDQVALGPGPLSSLSRKILRRLAIDRAGKQELIESVWGYSYEPLRHDSVVHAALAALRKSLGPLAAGWIETHDEGWLLSVTLIDRNERRNEKQRDSQPQAAPSSLFAPELNWRQLAALREVETRNQWSVPAYREFFKVSTMTAWRDLDGLVEKRYLVRRGHGRATAYLAP